MTLAVYFDIFAQFFLKHKHTFTFRLGPDRVSVLVEESSTKSPFEITLSEAVYIAKYLVSHHLNFPTYPFVAEFSVDGNIEVTITVTKV